LDEALALISSLQRKELIRDRALILLLYGGGLRVSEACALKWTDIRKKEHILRVSGKGSKERLVAVPSTVIDAVDALEKKGRYVFGSEPLDPRKAYAIVR